MFPTAANDLALHDKTITRIVDRLDSIRELPKSDTAYQVALDDIRGALRELPHATSGWLWTHYWLLYLLGGVIWPWPLVAFVRSDWLE